MAQRIIADLQVPMRLARHTLVVTPSIGIALYPADGAEVDTLLRNADLAMYYAKRKGPGMFAFYDASMNDSAANTLRCAPSDRRDDVRSGITVRR